MASSSNQIPAAATAVNESGSDTGAMRIQTVEVPGMIMISASLNVNALLYSSSSCDLWLELEARYGECDGTLLYKIQREINLISQGHSTVTGYYTKLKQLWDELVCLMPPAMCSCGLCICGCNKTKADQTDASQLIQFLMSLNDLYDNIRNQILDTIKTVVSNFMAFQNGIKISMNNAENKDLRTKQLLALGKQIRNLYILEPSSFTSVPQHCKSDIAIDNSFLCYDSDTYTLWHRRLGHNSFDTLHRIPVLKSIQKLQEPRSYKQAKGCPEWEEAMRQELQALDNNETWAVVDLPPGTKPIGSKWVFKTKLNPDGSVERHKARLVAKGIIRQWNQELTSKLLQFGFLQSAHDHCLFVKNTVASLLVLLTYVDELLIASPSESLIIEVKKFLHNAFSIKDLGLARYFLGLEIARSADGTSVSQHKYIRDIVQDTGLLHSRPTSTPLPLGLKLTSQGDVVLADPEPYRRLVGRLLYLSFTRPDICYGVQQLSQFVHRPCHSHMDAAFHLVRYLKGCQDKGLFFPASNSSILTGYCDADWASCTDSRRSLTGYCVFLGNALISWRTKKQSTVSRSTAEAEYRSMGAVVCELQWISYLLQDLYVSFPTPISLFCDNQAALHIVANPVFHERTRHLEIDCHLVRDKYKSGFILPTHIS
ncbi:Retrovirus-related Pol polyprotein from transposon RE2 [Sesamum angolense]|uniref:Retrovirus-related Pol polyprotein from transposon RE2 n=1 Tax=Sesamum angolense TaxID=2727404 RepID=A0AAE1T843_9LAMI|nr:Retrovirus-related Pol polyprotein from transposon RE2 [Sesamum angolense]